MLDCLDFIAVIYNLEGFSPFGVISQCAAGLVRNRLVIFAFKFRVVIPPCKFVALPFRRREACHRSADVLVPVGCRVRFVGDKVYGIYEFVVFYSLFDDTREFGVRVGIDYLPPDGTLDISVFIEVQVVCKHSVGDVRGADLQDFVLVACRVSENEGVLVVYGR